MHLLWPFHSKDLMNNYPYSQSALQFLCQFGEFGIRSPYISLIDNIFFFHASGLLNIVLT